MAKKKSHRTPVQDFTNMTLAEAFDTSAMEKELRSFGTATQGLGYTMTGNHLREYFKSVDERKKRR